MPNNMPEGHRAVTMTMPIELWQRMKLEAVLSGQDVRVVAEESFERELERRERERERKAQSFESAPSAGQRE